MGDPAAKLQSVTGRHRPSRPTRPRRLAIVVAAAAGVVVLGAGLLSAAGELGGQPTDVARASSPVGAACPTGVQSAAPSCLAPVPSGQPSASGSEAPGASDAVQTAPPEASSPPPLPGQPAAELVRRLQSALDRVRARLAIPGVSATVLLPDGSIWTGSSGLADVAARTKVTADTAFAYASVSKTFTSALILQLVDEGRLRLTDKAATLLPPLRLTLDRRITVAMLLNHTSGLADFFLNPKIDGPLQAHPTVAWSVDRTLRYVGKRLSTPGVAWHYSNTNYLLLGLIAERLTGQTLAEAIRTRLLEPAGLTATWYQAVEPARGPLAHGYRFVGTAKTARPIDLDDGSGVAPFRSVVSAAGGAGSIAGTSADLARWARALYSGRILGPQGTAILLSGFRKTTAYLPGVLYGFGIQALAIDGHPSLGHSGRLLGFRSAVRHFPIDGLTIAVLTNQSRADPALIVRALLAVAAPPPIVVPSGSPAPSSSAAP